MDSFKTYIFNVVVAFDRLCNAVFGGDPKDTISGRLARYKDSNWFARQIYLFLNWIEYKHCEDALKHDETPDDGSNAVLK